LADFNLGILSTLEIDSSSSKRKIEETITQIEKNLKRIRVDLEANSTSSSKNALRVSANQIVDSINKDGNLRKVKLDLDINKTQSVKNINKALNDIQKNYHRSISADINARVNPNEIKKSQKAIENSVKNTTSAANIPSSAGNIKETQEEVIGLGRSFRNIAEAQKMLSKTMADGMSYTTQKTENANRELKDYLITVNKVNSAGNKTGQQSYKFTGNNDGSLNLSEIKSLDSEYKSQLKTHEDISRAIDKQSQNILKLRDNGKLSSIEAEQLLAIYKKIGDERLGKHLTKDDFDAQHNAAQVILKDYEQQNKLLRVQQSLLAEIERNERRMADSINKRATNALKSDLLGLGSESKKFDTNAAYQMEQIRTQFRGIKAEAERATRSQLGFVESFRQAMIKFPVWMGASTLFFGAIQSGRLFIDTITEIDSKMITLAKVMSADTNLAEVFNNANDAALQFGQTISSALDVYAEFARQGTKGKELPQFANAALIAANVGEIDAKQAAEYLTSMSAQWETNGQDAMRQVDSLNEISNKYATTVEKLAQGQAKAGSTAKSMGLTFDQTNAVIGALTAKTKQSGDEIGNFMKAVLPKLYVGTGKATIEDLGIDMKDSNGQLKGAMALLEEVAQKIKGIDKDQQAAIVRGLGGTYHYQRMQVLLDDLGQVNGLYKQIEQTSENSAGSSLQENAKYMESVEAKINKAKVSLEQFSLALGDAFLKSGILDGIRLFTDLMTGLTAGITQLGSAAPLFGVVGAAASLFSRNVRSGFSDARQSMSDLIIEANNLNKVKDNLGNVTHVVPTGASSQLQFNNSGVYDKQASQAKSATTANYQLSKAQKEVSMSSLLLQGSINKTTVATTANATASRVASAAAVTLKGALRGLLAATGVGLVMTGISFGLEKLTGSFNATSQAAEEYEQQQLQTKQALQSMGSSEIDKMISSYDTLQQKMNSGKSFNSDEAQEYKNVVGQIANIFPELVSSEGQYGNTVNANAEVLKQRIDLMKQQLEIDKQIAQQKAISDAQELSKAKEKEANKIGGKGWFDGYDPETELKSNSNTQTNSKIDNQIAKVKSLTDAQKVLKTVNEQLSQATSAHDKDEVNRLTVKQDALSKYIGQKQMQSNAERAAIQAEVTIFNAQMAQMKSGSYSFGQAGTSALQSVSIAIQTTSDNVKNAREQFNALNSSLINDSGFATKMKSYESALKSFQTAKTQAERTDALPALEAAYEKVATAILKSAEAAHMSKDGIAQLRASLESGIEAETGLAAKVEKQGQVTISTTEAIKKKNKATADGTAINNENAESTDNQIKANEDLANSMREVASNQELVGKAIGEMQGGELSWNTMADLVDVYGEKILGLAGNEEALTNFLISERDKEKNHYLKTLEDKTMASEAYYKAVAGQGTELAEYLRKTYNIDSENYKSLAQLKAGIADIYSNGTADQQEALVNSIADSYDVDLSNYNTLAEKKDALETHVLNLLGKKWADHINELGRIANEAFAEFDDKMAQIRKAEAKELKSSKKGKYSVGADYTSGMVSAMSAGALGDDLLGANLKTSAVYLPKVMTDNMLKMNAQWKNATNTGKNLSSVSDALGKSLGDVGKQAQDSASGLGDTGSAGGKAGKGLKKAGDEADKTAKAMKKAGVEVETLYKTFTVTTYVADKLGLSMDKLNNKLEKQQLQTQKYATWSAKYRESLREENKLIDQKTKNLDKQMTALEKQIKSGNIKEYGLINQETNVPYYKYTANNLEGSKSGKVSAKGSSTQAKLWNFLISKGFSSAQAAGIMGNVSQESQFKASAQQYKDPYKGGKGLFQWDGARRNALYKYAKERGKSWKDVNVQLDFFWKELMTTETNAYNALKKTKTAKSAAQTFQSKYERAGIPNQSKRNSEADKYYKMYGMSQPISVSTAVAGTIGKSLIDGMYRRDKQFGHYNASDGGGKHSGFDYNGVKSGASIRAARSGVVMSSDWDPYGAGNQITIFDGKNTYTYMHMKVPSKFKVGQKVKAGQIVGQVGSTGNSSGTHLHLQVSKGKQTRYNNNTAVNPEALGYHKVAGSNYSISGKPIYGSMSGVDVEYANAAEEERLAAIERLINANNEAEAMKQKVDEARGKLLDLQLESLNDSKAKNDNLFKIAQSHVEQYDHLKELQSYQTAKLQYELDKIAAEKGTENDAWRNKNKQLQASKSLEKGFESSKINYIDKALKNKKTKKLFAADTVYGDELRRAKADAQQAIRDISADIRQGNAAIAASIYEQIMSDYNKATNSYEKTMKDISNKKAKLDLEDPKQANQILKYTKAQASQEEKRAAQIKFTIEQLKIQYANAKKNYELQKTIKEQMNSLNLAYADAKMAAYEFKIEVANQDIENQLNENAKALKKATIAYEKASYMSSFINQDGQIDLFRDNQVAQLKGLVEQRKALESNKKKLEDQLKLYKSLPTQAKKLRDEIENIDNAIKESNKSVHQVRYDLANGVINSIKTIYQKQLELATKAYDDEYKEYEKMINKKLKLIDEEAQDDQYAKDIKERTEAMNKLKNEISQRSGDDSLSNQAKVKELQEELKRQQEDYDSYLTNKAREDRKEALQEELEDKSEQIDKQKEDLNTAYQDLLEDTRKFNQMQEELMEGQVSKYKTLIEDLAKYVNEHMKEIGNSASQNILDALQETFGSLSDVAGSLKLDEKSRNPVPNSKLEPTTKTNITSAAIKAVNALAPSISATLPTVIASKLPASANTVKTITTNNNLAPQTLVTIQNFSGTQEELNSLTDDLATALRNKGLLK